MIIDLLDGNAIPTDSEVVVVGGGTVALVMGVLLSRRGVKTLLLESGGFGFEPDSQALNEASVLGKAHLGLADARARVLGGTSTLWGGQLARFQPIDFAAREGFGAAPWPIRYEDLRIYYDSIARLLGLSARLDDDVTLAKRLLGGAVPSFGDFELMFTRWLKEPNLFRYFRKELTSSANLRICLHAHVVKLSREKDGSIGSVTVACSNSEQSEIRTPRLVLANGTVEISRMLLATAQQDPSVSWANNRWVGASFQDHLDLRAARVRVLDEKRFSDLFQNFVFDGQKHQPKLRLSQLGGGSAAKSHIACSFSYESSLSEHLQYAKVMVRSMQRGRIPYNLRELTQHARGIAKVWWPMVSRYVRHHRIYNPADRGIFMTLHCEQAPFSESRITLDAAARDRFGVPQAALDWRVGGTVEVDSMRDFAVRLSEQLKSAGLAELELDDDLLRGDRNKVLDKTYDSYHQCGGARMGHDETDGVVDAELRVFGTPNLYVAGAATYRTSSYANPTFTALALGARLVDTLTRVPASIPFREAAPLSPSGILQPTAVPEGRLPLH
ncbi:GMC family oxidoreductase [Polaromonas sp.]|uniref:GMC family oxidoreductase n=1 Tax=Polaromonas sp. TaxID=1869339 RepID=UPI00352A5414